MSNTYHGMNQDKRATMKARDKGRRDKREARRIDNAKKNR